MAEPTVAMTLLMLGVAVFAIMLGSPLAFTLGGMALVMGMIFWGPSMINMFYLRLWGIAQDYTLLALPLFVFMGILIEKSNVAERLFGAIHLWMGGLRGGLAIATILLGTILAAALGVVSGSVVTLGLMALPAMLHRGYDKSLATGTVCAGGTLGILIPPSIMLIIYGPMAGLSVGRLFAAAVVPGLLLSAFYIAYVAVRCHVSPQLGPPLPAAERQVPIKRKLSLLLGSLIPPVLLIVGVLGSIFLGIAAPTEAASVGALGAILMAIAYRSFNKKVLTGTTRETLKTTGMIYGQVIGASMFTGVFLGLGCGDIVAELILGIPFGRWGAFAFIMFLVFIMGMFIDWIGILLILVPIITPIAVSLGFNPIWFAAMVCVNLQLSFMSPPNAPVVFFLRGICPPEWNIDTGTILKGVFPYLGLIGIGIALFMLIPDIILWLPNTLYG